MQKIHFGSAQSKLELIQNRVLQSIELTFAKVALHISDPQQFPIPSNSQTLEQAVKKYVNKLPEDEKNYFIAQGKAIAQSPSASRISRYGDLSSIPFDKPASIIDQVKTMPLPNTMKFDENDKNEIYRRNKHIRDLEATNDKPERVPRGAQPKTLRLSIDRLHCIDPQDVRKDEIQVNGFTVSAINQLLDVNTIELGKFKSGDDIAINKTIIDFDLREANVFPQRFFTGLFLIDKDSKKDDEKLQAKIDLHANISAYALALADVFGAVAIALVFTVAVEAIIITGWVLFALASIFAIYSTVFGHFLPQLRLSEVSNQISDAFSFDLQTLAPGQFEIRKFDVDLVGSKFEKMTGKYELSLKWARID